MSLDICVLPLVWTFIMTGDWTSLPLPNASSYRWIDLNETFAKRLILENILVKSVSGWVDMFEICSSQIRSTRWDPKTHSGPLNLLPVPHLLKNHGLD